MARTVRVIIYTTNESTLPDLRRSLTSIPEVRIVAELDEPSLLAQAVSQIPTDVAIVDLDPNAMVVIECVKQLSAGAPHLPVFALTTETDGNVVLSAMRAGVREYLVKPLNIDEFQQAVDRHVVEHPRKKETGKLIAIIGSAGGVGCTSLATNLAVELADLVGSERKVALVDLDFRFGHIATLLDVHGQYTVADLCQSPEQLDPQMVNKALVQHESGVYVLRRPHSFAQAELITAAHCVSVISTLQEMFDYVVVDGPTRHDPGGRSILDAADYNFLVLQLLVTSVRNTDRMMEEFGVQGFNTERIQLICNRVGNDSVHLDLEQVEAILNRKVFTTIATDWKAMSSSINVGQPLKTEYGKSKIRQDIRALAVKIHSPGAFEEQVGKRSGLFGKLLRKVTHGEAPDGHGAHASAKSPRPAAAG
jgi:pilus assembly protein CpaE